MKINDLDMSNWKSYDDILTDSLWIFESREKGFTRNGEYHGNFIPQIPRQAILRFTKKGEYILDPFAGLGTSLIEAKLLHRNSIGIELSKENVERIKKLLQDTPGDGDHTIMHGNAMDENIFKNMRKIQLAILHPPYWNAIKFTDDENDLSNSKNLNDFLSKFSKIVKNVSSVLDSHRYLVLVIGDIYRRGNVIPLGFLTMNEILKNEYQLKGIVVKNIEENRGKRGKYSLWRYRALLNGFYIFKHEYVIFFKKK
ncbi:MAG: TRM11 family SAM-dependent methyltransferase [Thermoplasmata archaeon]|nr:DNA methyltransferase [Thermoplasmata archaeon]